MSYAQIVEIVCAVLVLAVVLTVFGTRLAFWFVRRGTFGNAGGAMPRTLAPIALALLLSTNFLTIFSHGLFGLGSRFTGAVLIGLTALLMLHGVCRRC
jgi:hypothetical protein